MQNDFTALISEYALAAGIALSDEQVRLCRIHIELMIEWNRRLNLTRITEPREIVVKHLLDSLLPASALPGSGLALDVGTGAGFPGIPLKILLPDIEMVLLDSSRKKVSFLAVVAAKLGLGGIRAVHGRWEDFAGQAENRNKLQLITMRAVRIEERHLSTLAVNTLRPGGIFAWWAGPESEATAEELARSPITGLSPRENFSYTLPKASKPRSIVSWKKTGD